MRMIQYAVDTSTGLVTSRIGSVCAVPILDYDNMLPSNNYEQTYYLEKTPVHSLASCWNDLHWTRKIPIELKNKHREFWGMKPLKG